MKLDEEDMGGIGGGGVIKMYMKKKSIFLCLKIGFFFHTV